MKYLVDHKIQFAFILVFVIVWMGIIYTFSNMDSGSSNGKSISIIDKTINKVLIITGYDSDESLIKSKQIAQQLNLPLRKVMHASVFCILSILICHMLKLLKVKKCYIFSVIFCMLYASIDEIHQLFVPGRNGNFIDVLIDTTGSIIGVLIYFLLIKKYQKLKKKHNKNAVI